MSLTKGEAHYQLLTLFILNQNDLSVVEQTKSTDSKNLIDGAAFGRLKAKESICHFVEDAVS